MVPGHGVLSILLRCDATLSRYSDGHGWAPKGKAWLSLAGEAGGSVQQGRFVTYSLDVPRSLTLRTPQGGVITGRGEVVSGRPAPPADGLTG